MNYQVLGFIAALAILPALWLCLEFYCWIQRNRDRWKKAIKNKFRRKHQWYVIAEKNKDAVTYDGRNGEWGQHIQALDYGGYKLEDKDRGTYTKVCGHWSRIPKPGDTVVMKGPHGNLLCGFIEVEQCSDPPDMFFGIILTLDYVTEAWCTVHIDYVSGSRYVRWGPEPGNPNDKTPRDMGREY